MRRAAAALLASLALTACTSSQDAEPAPAAPTANAQQLAEARDSGVLLEAQLSLDSGAIDYPLDSFLPTRAQSLLLDTAVQLDGAACARDENVTYFVPVQPAPPEYDQETLDGPWTTAQAERFAFVQPMPEADLRGNGIAGAPEAPPETPREVRTLGDIPVDSPDRAIIEGCLSNSDIAPTFARAQSPSGAWLEQLTQAEQGAQESTSAQQLRSELRSCLEQAGLTVDPEAYAAGRLGPTAGLAGADAQTIDAHQVSLALQVVSCKQQVQYTERAAALVAAAQASIVVANLDELRAFKDNLDQQLAKAEQIVAQNASLQTTW